MATEDELRSLAVRSVKRKKAFWRLLAVYIIIDAFMVGVWLLSGRGYFWPGWVFLASAFGLAFTGWNAFGGARAGEASEADIKKEMDKLRGAE